MPCVTGSEVERPWRPDKSNAIGSIVGMEWHIGEEGLDLLGQLKVLDLSISHLIDVSLDLLESLVRLVINLVTKEPTHFTLERALCPFVPESEGSPLEDVVQGPDCRTPRLVLHAPR